MLVFSSGFSNVKNYKLQVGNGNVISKPDAIIYNPRQKNMDCSQVIAVVKVGIEDTPHLIIDLNIVLVL